MKRKYFLLGLVLVLVMFLVGCGGGIPTVPNQSPTANFTANPTSGIAPLEVAFDASNSSDSDGSITSYQWDFKDGNTGTGETANHTFSSIGSYNVNLTVTDNDGATDSTTKTITVTETTNQSPVASFTANPTSGIAPLEVAFDASNSSDSDGSITSYAWDFKDGDTGTEQTINHTFSSSGSYNVLLTVTDNDGVTDSTTKTITVNPPEPSPSGKVVATLDNWEQEYYQYLEEWSMVYAYYTIENNSSETIYDYKIYFGVNCVDSSIYYDSWYEGYTLSPGQSHSDYALIETFGKQADSVKINELAVNVYH